MYQKRKLNQFLNGKDDVINISDKAEFTSLKIEENNLQSIIEPHSRKEQNGLLFMDEFIFN